MFIIKKVAYSAIIAIFSLVSLLLSHSVNAAWDLNMPQGVTPISNDIYHLHMTIFYICVAIGVLVFGVMIYSLIFHRKSRGAVAAEFHSHNVLEIVWAIVPFIILVAMAIPATKVLMNMENPSEADLTIRIIGHQWKWEYEYLDQGIQFFSNLSTTLEQIQNKKPKDEWYLLEVDHPLILPIHKKIRFLVTSKDVIHSWWVPDLGVKRDAIPGFINEAWARIDKEGIYRGQCAELCGINHGFMPIVVNAVSEKAFDDFVNKQAASKQQELMSAEKVWTKDDLMKLGESAYNKTCVACHKTDGTGTPPVFPALKGSSVAVGKDINRHINIVLNGVPGSAMQAFGKQLTDAEIAAVVTYERNAWGNNTGDVIQPSTIKAAHNKK